MMEGSQSSSLAERALWDRLTGKQRACLDLLLERKTSKQIALELKIAKPTVDQRITTARHILGATDRDDAALRYARLKNIYDRITCDPVHIPPVPCFVPSDFADGDPSEPMQANARGAPVGSWGQGLPFGKVGSHDHGSFVRLAIVAAILVAIVIFLLGGLGIAQALTRLISG
ncbi:helix-turn-helix transcriptional regulator [Sphingopyxis sp. LARHCG72]